MFGIFDRCLTSHITTHKPTWVLFNSPIFPRLHALGQVNKCLSGKTLEIVEARFSEDWMPP